MHCTVLSLKFLFSRQNLYPTFARTRPSATLASKSAASLLLKYNWTRVAFFYANRTDSDYGAVAEAVIQTFAEHGIEIRQVQNPFDTTG